MRKALPRFHPQMNRAPRLPGALPSMLPPISRAPRGSHPRSQRCAPRGKKPFSIFCKAPSIIRSLPPFADMTLCTCSVSKTLYTAIISSFCRETARSCSFSAPRCCICERAMRSISTVIPLPRSRCRHVSQFSFIIQSVLLKFCDL